MSALSSVIILFIVLESANVFILYFFPKSNKGNGVGMFNAYERSKKDPEMHYFIKYLIYWVAGSKIIFIALLIVILMQGDEKSMVYAAVAMIISISTFFWKLFPLIKTMDANNQISPKGYSRTLSMMIVLFMAMFVLSLLYRTFIYST